MRREVTQKPNDVSEKGTAVCAEVISFLSIGKSLPDLWLSRSKIKSNGKRDKGRHKN